MQSGLLLLVDADRRSQRGVTRVAGEMGIEVVTCDSARAGLNAACALEPAAIVTELELPDFDGYWFVAQIRQQPTDVATCPIVVVTHEIDTSSRAGTLKAGADVFLQKPIAPADLVAQTRALVDMTSRVRDRRGAPPQAVIGAGIAPVALAAPHLLPPSGGLDRFPAATVLVGLELERRSGRLTLRPPGSVAPPVEIDIASGLIIEGRTQGKKLDPLAVVRASLALSDGYFEFVPGPDRPALPTCEFTGKLFAMAAAEPPPRSRRHAAPPPPPPVEVIEPSLIDEVLSERPLPAKAASKSATKPPPAKTESARAPRESVRPPRESVRPGAARASRAPKAPTRPPPVKVPAPRVPAFGPAALADVASKPPAAPAAIVSKPPAPRAVVAPGAAANNKPPPPKPPVPKPPLPKPPLARPPVQPRPDAEEDDAEDVIEAENDG